MSDREDRITDAILRGSAYERVLHTERGLFTVPAPRTFTIQAALLVTLSSVLPLYLLFPASVGVHVPTTDPFAASPKLLVLGFFGFGAQILGALGLLAATGYRLWSQPLTEGQARTVIDAQRVATGLSVVTGGVGVCFTVGIVALGVAGPEPLGTYLGAIAGSNPFTEIGVGLTVAHLGIASALSAVVVLGFRTVVLGLHAEE